VQVQVQVISNWRDRVEVNKQEDGAMDLQMIASAPTCFVVVEGLLKNLNSIGRPRSFLVRLAAFFAILLFFWAFNWRGASLLVGICSTIVGIAHLSPMALPNKQVGPSSINTLIDQLEAHSTLRMN
jgi:hypothetical protein